MPAEVRNRTDELRKQTSEIATDLQSLSHELHSARLDVLGMAAVMRGFCREFAEEQKSGDRLPNAIYDAVGRRVIAALPHT